MAVMPAQPETVVILVHSPLLDGRFPRSHSQCFRDLFPYWAVSACNAVLGGNVKIEDITLQFSPPALAGPSSKLAAFTHQVDMKMPVMRNYRAIAVGELICLPFRPAIPVDLNVMNQYLPESSEERPYPPSPVESDGSASPRTEPTSTRDRVDASDNPASPLSEAAQALVADAAESLTPVPPPRTPVPPAQTPDMSGMPATPLAHAEATAETEAEAAAEAGARPFAGANAEEQLWVNRAEWNIPPLEPGEERWGDVPYGHDGDGREDPAR